MVMKTTLRTIMITETMKVMTVMMMVMMMMTMKTRMVTKVKIVMSMMITATIKKVMENTLNRQQLDSNV